MKELTPTAIKVLNWCIACGDGEKYPGALAKKLWPGRRGSVVNGYAKAAGSLLGKYRKAGLLTMRNNPTPLALEMLARVQPGVEPPGLAATPDERASNSSASGSR